MIGSSQRDKTQHSKQRDICASVGIFYSWFSVLHLYYFFVLAVPFVLIVQHKHPCPRRDLNPQPQQASALNRCHSDCRSTPFVCVFVCLTLVDFYLMTRDFCSLLPGTPDVFLVHVVNPDSQTHVALYDTKVQI